MYHKKNHAKGYDNLKLRAFLTISPILACAKCGFADYRALCLDHINGDGWKFKPRNKGESLYRDIIHFGNIQQVQILCANCNMIKAVENGELEKNK